LRSRGRRGLVGLGFPVELKFDLLVFGVCCVQFVFRTELFHQLSFGGADDVPIELAFTAVVDITWLLDVILIVTLLGGPIHHIETLRAVAVVGHVRRATVWAAVGGS